MCMILSFVDKKLSNFNLFHKILFSIIVIFSFNSAKANGVEDSSKSDFVLEHVKDSYSWHIATLGHFHITIPLPIILYSANRGVEIFMSSNFYDSNHHSLDYLGYYLNEDGHVVSRDEVSFLNLSITKNVFYMLVSVLILLFLLIKNAKKIEAARYRSTTGFPLVLETLVLFVRDDIVMPNIGRNKYKRYMPYMLTMFFFIWLNNLLGLLPAAANVTGNISVSLVLAVFTFLVTNFNGTKSYWSHIFYTPGVPMWLLPIMIPVEIIGIFTKPIALTIRLFANITAGHIILLSIINLIFIMGNEYVGLISVPFGAFMLILKLLVAFLQAYIFTLLSSIYIGSAVSNDGH